MPASHHSPSSRFNLAKMAFMFVFCAGAAIASRAQTLTTLASFDGTNGYSPQSALVQGNDGNFYGTTAQGGLSDNCTAGCGTVFKMTPSGTLASLYSFCSQPGCADGTSPYAALIQAADGNFYGVTGNGGRQQQLRWRLRYRLQNHAERDADNAAYLLHRKPSLRRRLRTF